jgi:hypothetical protein
MRLSLLKFFFWSFVVLYFLLEAEKPVVNVDVANVQFLSKLAGECSLARSWLSD